MTVQILKSQTRDFADYAASVRAFAATLKMWAEFAAKAPPERAVGVLLFIADLRDAADPMIAMAISADHEPDFEIIDDAHFIEKIAHTDAGLPLN